MFVIAIEADLLPCAPAYIINSQFPIPNFHQALFSAPATSKR